MVASDVSTKQCPSCCGEIDCRAKKCPHCLSYLGFRRQLYRLAVVFIWASCISFLVCTVIAATLMSREFRDRSVSVVHSADIEVLSSAIAFVPDNYQDSKARRLAIVGRAQNRETSRVQYVTFRVEVMNGNGKLVDVFSDTASGPFAANEQFGFELSNTMHTLDLPESEYVSHKLVVQQAQFAD